MGYTSFGASDKPLGQAEDPEEMKKIMLTPINE